MKIKQKNIEDLYTETTFLSTKNTQLIYTKVGFLNVKIVIYNLSGIGLLLLPYKTESKSDYQ